MPYKTRRCIWENCGKGGAYHFNNLCPEHWQMIIDRNIKEFVKEFWENEKEPL